MGADQQFSLRWNNYLSHITNAFDSLRSDEDLVDVTLSCEGKKVRAHKMLLSACSTYFKDLFKENPCQHPIIILQNVKFSDLSALISFMYQGEVNVEQEQLPSFLQTAELLAIQGLTEDNDKEQDMDDQTDTIEVPDSPEMIPTKPEHSVSKPLQRKSSIAQNPLATNMGSPSSVYPDSMPPAKRRRGMGSKGGGDRDSEHILERRQSIPVSHAPPPPRSVSPDPVEIIPLAPVKSEVSDYIDQSQEDVSSYADSHGGDSLSQIEQIMMPSDTKTEILYGNDSSMLSSGDSLSAADLNQMLSKPGPSGDSQGQDAIQDLNGSDISEGRGDLLFASYKENYVATEVKDLSEDWNPLTERYYCNECGTSYKQLQNYFTHVQSHSEMMRCHLCRQVLTRRAHLARHLLHVHKTVLRE